MYSDIFHNDLTKQTAVAQLFASLIGRREDTSASITGPVSAQDPQGSVTAQIFVQLVLITECLGINRCI